MSTSAPPESVGSSPVVEFTGSCLCRQNTYSYSGPLLGPISCCHCEQCRRQSSIAGGGGLGVLPVSTGHLRWTNGGPGSTETKEFKSSEDKFRAFCVNCGTGLYSRRETRPGVIRLRVGTVDPGSAVDSLKIGHRIFVKEAPEWSGPIPEDGVARWSGLEPGR